ncbi:MAG: YfcE family phosphodiesterase [Nanoarchaeota archaeon]|nr:YfcE family phosphodiesterase [Nanoarchaeota archaeon]
MKIGVISDIHDNRYNLRNVLIELKEKNIEKLIILGDSNSPFIIKEICETLQLPIIFVWGNNDGDKVVITQIINSSHKNSVVSSQSFLAIEIDGKKLFLTHFPELANLAEKSQQFDAVMYGHDHLKFIQKNNGVLLLNPGSIYANKELASYAIYDSKMNLAEIFEIEDSRRPF